MWSSLPGQDGIISLLLTAGGVRKTNLKIHQLVNRVQILLTRCTMPQGVRGAPPDVARRFDNPGPVRAEGVPFQGFLVTLAKDQSTRILV